jgi:cytochrome bd ubiquinol oxidase subunit I
LQIGDPAVFLARLQFAFTIGLHIILPALSIGLASYLMVLEALWLRTRRQVYLDLFQYWLKVFAISFGMGVVSGLVMSARRILLDGLGGPDGRAHISQSGSRPPG